MPYFRGIELSIVAASDHSVFPEYPHPDGSSVRLDGLQSSRYNSAMFLSPRRRREVDGTFMGDGQQHADPKISVYIPSAPDTNFYFRYTFGRPQVGHNYLFFLVIINGRHVVSWGTELSETTVGVAHQALFQPSAHYQHNDNGVIMTEYGIESRCFRFVNHGSGETSVANDGGLIQVQVYRARSRRRIAPHPEEYRGGDNYGIALISNGLLENPETADYYNYHLIDAADEPYATFRFHYRSWENLTLLHLAPDDKPEFLTATPSKTGGEEQNNAGFDFSANASGRAQTQQASPSTQSPSNFAVGGPMSRRTERPLPALPIRRKSLPSFKIGPEEDTEIQEEHSADDPPSDDTFGSAAEHRVQHPRKISAASKSSATSNVSIAKSLEAYADGEDGLLVDTMEFGSAVKLETVYQGKAKEKEKEPSPASPISIAGAPGTMSGDDTLFGTGPPFTPCTDRLAVPPLRTRPRAIYVAPFTDNLCKREMAPPPGSPPRRRSRRVTLDPGPRSSSRGSSGSRSRSRPRRTTLGGSLDSRYQPFFMDEDQ